MTILDYTTLQVGQRVGIARHASWSILSEGIYTVAKANKMKVTVKRDSDGYERVFSVKRRCEAGAEDRYRAAYLESLETLQAREAEMKVQRAIRAAWNNAEHAAKHKNLTDLLTAVQELQSLLAD